jgi:hypothetical protein
MLSIKPLPMATLGTLQLLLRFYQRYTQWIMVKASFLAEDRTDI